MEKCLLTDLPSKMKKDEVSGKLKCSNCLFPVKNFQQLQDHYTMHHRMKFKCPKEGCDFNKKNPEVLLLDFVKHWYQRSWVLMFTVYRVVVTRSNSFKCEF